MKYWTTFNEAWTFTVLGYGTGSKAPGKPFADIARYPYITGHNVLLAHAEAVEAFRADPTLTAAGAKIGITNNWCAPRGRGPLFRPNSNPHALLWSAGRPAAAPTLVSKAMSPPPPPIVIPSSPPRSDFTEPGSSSAEDIAAAERVNEWWLAWFTDPIWLGHYPASMVQKLGDRLPSFSASEAAKLKGSADFFGLNHYGSRFATHAPSPAGYGVAGSGLEASYWGDFEADTWTTAEMPTAASVWLFSVPWGLRKLLNWVDQRYAHPPIYVTENGWSTPGEESAQEGVVDDGRVLFYHNYTGEVQRAIVEDGGVRPPAPSWCRPCMLACFLIEGGTPSGLLVDGGTTQRDRSKRSQQATAAGDRSTPPRHAA